MSPHSLFCSQFKVNFRNCWLYCVFVFFIGWVIASFYIPYYRFTNGFSSIWFFKEFTDYLIYSQIVLTAVFTYLITKGHLSEIKNYLKQIIVFTSILVVFAFIFFQWMDITTEFGQYGYYVENNDNPENLLYIDDGVYSDFERETLYREAWVYNYNLAFQQIWTFGAFVFISTFLLIMVLDKKRAH